MRTAVVLSLAFVLGAEPSADKPLRTDAGGMFSAYLGNAAKGDATYADKPLEVWGLVVGVDPYKGGYAVKLMGYGDRQVGDTGVWCVLPRSEAKAIADINPGSRIALNGTVDRWDANSKIVFVKDCKGIRKVTIEEYRKAFAPTKK
jgi:hypothetical protein